MPPVSADAAILPAPEGGSPMAVPVEVELPRFGNSGSFSLAMASFSATSSDCMPE